MEKTLLRDTETAAILGCCRATVWALAKAGTIPAPLKIGAMARWRIADIQAVIDKAAAIAVSPVHRKRTRCGKVAA